MKAQYLFLSASVCCAWLLSAETSVNASDWMFRRSYFSHDAASGQSAAGLSSSRSAHRQAFIGAHPRFAIRGGYRYNNITIQNGTSSDRTVIRENWVDAGY